MQESELWRDGIECKRVGVCEKTERKVKHFQFISTLG